MKKNLTEIVFILDRSGSMAGLEADTIGGFNAMIEKQKAEPGQAMVSTVLFDNEIQVIHDRVPLEKIPPLTEKEYFVRGCTALLDAVRRGELDALRMPPAPVDVLAQHIVAEVAVTCCAWSRVAPSRLRPSIR